MLAPFKEYCKSAVPVLFCLCLSAVFVEGTWQKSIRDILGTKITEPLTWSESLQEEFDSRFRTNYNTAIGRDFSGMRFSGKELHIHSYYHSTLTNAAFEQANLRGVLFFQSRLKEARFNGSVQHFVYFQNNNMNASDLRESKFSKVSFFRNRLREADFRGSEFSDSYMFLNDLRGATFNSSSNLPFPHEEALRRGMIYVE